ncbi:hypothetical protein C8R44DRAFT_747079 [Mycena epipterygia]|nr:hypothetical protein C8R44DRAFT_747079 [Mycena epipterygia]
MSVNIVPKVKTMQGARKEEKTKARTNARRARHFMGVVDATAVDMSSYYMRRGYGDWGAGVNAPAAHEIVRGGAAGGGLGGACARRGEFKVQREFKVERESGIRIEGEAEREERELERREEDATRHTVVAVGVEVLGGGKGGAGWGGMRDRITRSGTSLSARTSNKEQTRTRRDARAVCTLRVGIGARTLATARTALDGQRANPGGVACPAAFEAAMQCLSAVASTAFISPGPSLIICTNYGHDGHAYLMRKLSPMTLVNCHSDMSWNSSPLPDSNILLRAREASWPRHEAGRDSAEDNAPALHEIGGRRGAGRGDVALAFADVAPDRLRACGGDELISGMSEKRRESVPVDGAGLRCAGGGASKGADECDGAGYGLEGGGEGVGGERDRVDRKHGDSEKHGSM